MHVLKPLALGAALALGMDVARAAVIGPELSGMLDTAADTDILEVIVSFEGNGRPTGDQVASLNALGLAGVTMRNLPIAGVVATPADIAALNAMADVRSIYFNAPLEYDMQEATQLTGVDRLRADRDVRPLGVPVSGQGVAVLVNDSGIDATHPDLRFGTHVVENVLGHTNLAGGILFEHTWTEGVHNTDIAGGHGTHVAGIVGGSGEMSDGSRMQGVAPGADIVGYGSGGVIFVLDTIGGFDYALENRDEHNIRVVSNSFGRTADTGSDFDPNDPTNIATKALADQGVIVVFSAGNSGSGEGTITGNFKKAPWVITVANGDKGGSLVDSSSRGRRQTGGEVIVDGESYTWVDRPTVTAPGTDIYAARDSLSSGTDLLGVPEASEHLAAHELPFYTAKTGTSMAAPHISGVVALMLEADPSLHWSEVKAILEQTATNMPGREPWEAGAGYVNAYAAVEAVLERATFGETTNVARTFNANANVSVASREKYDVEFSPVGEREEVEFYVGADISFVEASANVGNNTVAIRLTDPAGNSYGSSIALPVLGQNIAASGPGMEGIWKLRAGGIGGISGVAVDPLGLTNGYALPTAATGSIEATVTQIRVDEITGLNDANGHAAQAFIESAVTRRLVDSDASGNYRPDDSLTRAELAEFMVMGMGVRQAPSKNRDTFADVSAAAAPFVDAVMTTGAALKDTDQSDFALMLSAFDAFDAFAPVTREQLAYSVVQALGLQEAALSFSGNNSVVVEGVEREIEDQDDITNFLRGYVQLAVANNLIAPQIVYEQDPFGVGGTLVGYFHPNQVVSRAEFAAIAVRFANAYTQ